MELEVVAGQFNPSTDLLVAARDLKLAAGTILTGSPLPLDDFTPEQVRRLIVVKHATVAFGAKRATKNVVVAPPGVVPSAEAVVLNPEPTPQAATTTAEAVAQPAKKRGRPAGAKNKPKA